MQPWSVGQLTAWHSIYSNNNKNWQHFLFNFVISTTGDVDGDCKKFIGIPSNVLKALRSSHIHCQQSLGPLILIGPSSDSHLIPNAYCLPQPQFLLILSIAIVNLFIKKTLHKFSQLVCCLTNHPVPLLPSLANSAHFIIGCPTLCAPFWAISFFLGPAAFSSACFRY